MSRTVFGIGCLSFVPFQSGNHNDVPDGETQTAWWQDQIETGLGILSSITDLDVEVKGAWIGDGFRSEFVPEGNVEYDIEYRFGLSRGSFVAFTVTIPKRMQPILIPWSRAVIECERFRLVTAYDVGGPVTFVRCLADVGDDARPSEVVALVREFLKRELEQLGSELRLVAVGPSPFHADFALRPLIDRADVSDPWMYGDHELVWIVHDPGFDTVTAYYDGDAEELDSAYVNLIESMQGPFSLYYQVVRGVHRRDLRTHAVGMMSEELIAMHTRRGWFSRVFRSGLLARELLITAISVKQSESDELSEARRSLSQVSSYRDFAPLTSLIARESEKSFTSELDISMELARLLEGSRLKQYEVLVLAAATGVGGLAGAVAAVITG